jgi:type IV pilus assembly protein PilO
MTFADDFALEGEGAEQPEYPSIFGISFTPTVGGVLCALLGLGAAVALGWYVVKPAWDSLQAKETELSDIQGQIDALQAAQQEINQLALEQQQLQVQKQEILSLFASEDKLDTYLYDLSQQVQSRQGQLIKFEPGAAAEGGSVEPVIVADGSLGTAADGLLKTKTFNVSVEGTFDQTQSILRSIEALQLLSSVKDFNTQASQETEQVTYDPAKTELVPASKPKLNTTFTLETLVPLSAEELEAAAQANQAAAAQPVEGEQPVE